MPRRSIVEDDDDAVPLSDLLRTGEASRLRRRGAMRATARRDDEEDALLFPFPRGIKGEELYLELECGVRSGAFSFAPAGPSRPSPLPRSSSPRTPLDLGVVFSSTGCGAIVSTRAFPSSIAAKHVYTSTEPVSSDIAHLHHKYLDSEQRALAETLMKDVSMCQCDWEAVGCRVWSVFMSSLLVFLTKCQQWQCPWSYLCGLPPPSWKHQPHLHILPVCGYTFSRLYLSCRSTSRI